MIPLDVSMYQASHVQQSDVAFFQQHRTYSREMLRMKAIRREAPLSDRWVVGPDESPSGGGSGGGAILGGEGAPGGGTGVPGVLQGQGRF